MGKGPNRPKELHPTPGQFAEVSRDYYTAARRLYDGSPDDIGPFRSAFFTLIAFSLELSFKAALSKAGYNERHLTKIGHDLDEACVKAAECGLYTSEDCGPDLVTLVQSLHQNHLQHAFRYPLNISIVQVPHPAFALRTLEKQIATVEQFVFPMPGGPYPD